jgi:hypothetical protein
VRVISASGTERSYTIYDKAFCAGREGSPTRD